MRLAASMLRPPRRLTADQNRPAYRVRRSRVVQNQGLCSPIEGHVDPSFASALVWTSPDIRKKLPVRAPRTRQQQEAPPPSGFRNQFQSVKLSQHLPERCSELASISGTSERKGQLTTRIGACPSPPHHDRLRWPPRHSAPTLRAGTIIRRVAERDTHTLCTWYIPTNS